MQALDRKNEHGTYSGEYVPVPPLAPASSPRQGLCSLLRKGRIGLLALAIQIAVLLAIHGFSLKEVVPDSTTSGPGDEFDWFALEPKADIEWTPCYSDKKCARLLLPLDYETPDGPTTAIALRMIPATDGENYQGTLFLNPGGPGGSGTEFVARTGKNISNVVGPSFDVLGFDPRGTGLSTPLAECFESASQRSIYVTQEGHQLLNASDSSVGVFHARAKLLAQRCEEKIGGEWGIGRFLSTASVARDMLEISKKLGQDQLQYWGFSYGSVLGQYFAAMYPDNVKRLVIDGVYDAQDYRAGRWGTNIVDIESSIEALFTFCHRAGPEKCALYESTPAQIRKRFFSILDAVDKEPVALPLAEPPAVITRKALVNQFFQATYKPLTSFVPVINVAHAIETGNTTALYALLPDVITPTECKCDTGKAPEIAADTEATFAIGCGDADKREWDLEAYKEYYKSLEGMSHFMAPMWGIFWMQCTEWRIHPKGRWTGPLEARNTSHPILVVSPTHDPVTPYHDALIVHKRYGGAGLLVQDSYGHCSLSAPSLCTIKHIRKYFQEGVIPEEGTVCEVDELPIVGKVDQAGVRVRAAEDLELLDALKGLSAAMPMTKFI